MAPAKSDRYEQLEVKLRKRGYTLGKELGSGTYATVYYSEYNVNDQYVCKLACKVIDTSRASKDFVTKFFPREISIIRQLDHPNLVKVHSILQEKELYMIFMTFCENGDLLEYLRANGPVPESQGKVWFYQILLGLQYLHKMDIAHRDLKCENVLLTGNNNVKIADFGFARLCQANNAEDVTSRTFCGSVAYACPEILLGNAYEPKSADMWSMGIILYVMINKSLPFVEDGNRPKKMADRQIKRNWKFKPRALEEYSKEARDTVMLLMEPKATLRLTIAQALELPWLKLNSKDTSLISTRVSDDFAQVKKRKQSHSKSRTD